MARRTGNSVKAYTSAVAECAKSSIPAAKAGRRKSTTLGTVVSVAQTLQKILPPYASVVTAKNTGQIVRYYTTHGWKYGTLIGVGKSRAKVGHIITGAHNVPLEDVQAVEGE